MHPHRYGLLRAGQVRGIPLTLTALVVVMLWPVAATAAPDRGPPAAPPVDLAGPYRFPTGLRPESVASGDFNEDGVVDMVNTNGQSGGVGLLFGTGAGRFEQAVILDPEGSLPKPVTVVVADLDGDSHADLAVSSDDVVVLLGDGAGDFGAPRVFPTGNSAGDLAVADFDGDGVPDLAVMDRWQSDDVSVLLGDGAGGFATPASSPSGERPRAVDVGDVDGDGDVDLAVTSILSETVSVLLGDGAGGFGPPTNTALGSRPGDLTLGDFQGDGRLDVAVVTGEDTVTILSGDGSGRFTTRRDHHVVPSTNYLEAVDFDADTIMDLVLTSGINGIFGGGPRTVSVVIGDGQQGFLEPVVTKVSVNPTPPEVADLDGSGTLDIAVGTSNGDKSQRRGATVSVIYQTSR